MKKNSKNIFILAGSLALMTSCADNKSENSEVENVSTQLVQTEDDTEKVERIKKVFHALPSPLEFTSLFKKEGVNYHSEKLHQTTKRKQYNLIVKKALNLGVYGADLSYSGLFGRHEAAVEYFAASQILAEDLGIGRTFQNGFISRLEENAGNKDTLLQVVGDFFLENDTYLKNYDQQDISTFILTGGWIEGIYLGTQMADENSNNKGIRDIVIDQKASLHNVIILLQNLNKSEGAEDLVKEIGELEVYYSQIENDSESGTLVVQDSTFQKIKDKVAAIRTNIIK